MILLFDPGDHDTGLDLLDVPDTLDLSTVEALLTVIHHDEKGKDYAVFPRVLGAAAHVDWRGEPAAVPLWRHLPSRWFFHSRGIHYHDLTRPWTPPPLAPGHYALEDGDDTFLYVSNERLWTLLTPDLAAWFLARWTEAGSHRGEWMMPAFRAEVARRWPQETP